MKTYIVSRMAYFDERVEIEAETEQEAIEIAQTTSGLDWERTFLETDNYEIAEEIEDEE